MGVITRSTHPSALWPGIKEWFGIKYREHAPEWSQLFEKGTSDKAYEKLVEGTGFGLAQIKGEGSSIMYDSDGEGYTNILTHIVYGLGYIVTREELEDSQYEAISRRRSTNLAFSMRQTAEIDHANFLNRAFSGSYNLGDGVPLISNAHPTLGGLQSNLLTAADLSETALEDGLKQVMRATNSRGMKIDLRVRKLVVSTDDVFNAQRILGSDLRVGTANNDINALKAMGAVPEVVANHYLTDPDAWFLITDAPSGLQSLWRREVELEKDNDFDTENAKAKATMRYARGTGDWRAIYGNPGV